MGRVKDNDEQKVEGKKNDEGFSCNRYRAIGTCLPYTMIIFEKSINSYLGNTNIAITVTKTCQKS